MERLRAGLATLIISLIVAVIAASPALDRARGLSIDVLTALRWHVFGNAHPPASSPTVVVALDEETFRTPPFEGTPSSTWTREIGQVLTALLDGGAKVVGFDAIFPTSIEQSAVAFGDDTLGARVRGFDRDFLRALALGARAGKVVLGQVQHQDYPVMPSPGQRAAVGYGQNIRALNAYSDPDDVIRRMPLRFIVDGERVPSMPAELAARATGAPAVTAGAGIVPNTITLNFSGGADIPTYSLADLRACVEKGDKDFFRRHFDGKVVLIGSVLDVEDRKITSKRFATGPEGAHAERCALPTSAAGRRFTRDSIPGVYLHATAVNNLIRGDALREFGRFGTGVIAFALAAIGTTFALSMGPVAATLAYLAVALAWTAAATIAFREGLVLPLIAPLLSGLAGLDITIAYRFVVTDRNKRLLRQSFALYLSPAVIEKMVASNKPPALGGEMRNVTVYFSDIADFTGHAETITPAELVAAMNEYLSAMTDIIEAHGGLVDKYIGDGIVAVFGAPLDDHVHVDHAVRAALQCAARLPGLDRMRSAFGGEVRQRIGLNSGEALVGNIGSRRRFNYTVMGDVVNLASRLEGANKAFGTTILASETTRAAASDGFVWREIDAIRVKGRAEPVKIYEPLGLAGEVPAERRARAEAYAEGLARYCQRDFTAAAQHFAHGADADPPSARFLARAQELARHPPGPDWQGVNTLDEK